MRAALLAVALLALLVAADATALNRKHAVKAHHAARRHAARDPAAEAAAEPAAAAAAPAEAAAPAADAAAAPAADAAAPAEAAAGAAEGSGSAEVDAAAAGNGTDVNGTDPAAEQALIEAVMNAAKASREADKALFTANRRHRLDAEAAQDAVSKFGAHSDETADKLESLFQSNIVAKKMLARAVEARKVLWAARAAAGESLEKMREAEELAARGCVGQVEDHRAKSLEAQKQAELADKAAVAAETNMRAKMLRAEASSKVAHPDSAPNPSASQETIDAHLTFAAANTKKAIDARAAALAARRAADEAREAAADAKEEADLIEATCEVSKSVTPDLVNAALQSTADQAKAPIGGMPAVAAVAATA